MVMSRDIIKFSNFYAKKLLGELTVFILNSIDFILYASL